MGQKRSKLCLNLVCHLLLQKKIARYSHFFQVGLKLSVFLMAYERL